MFEKRELRCEDAEFETNMRHAGKSSAEETGRENVKSTVIP